MKKRKPIRKRPKKDIFGKVKKMGRPALYPSGKQQEAIALRKVLSYWCIATPIILDTKLFSFKKHEYLIDVYNSDRRIECYQKAAQMGFSTRTILESIHKGKYLYPNGVLYLFPTKTDVTDFSKSKFARLMKENPLLQSWVKDTDAANIKSIGRGSFYFRGMKTRGGLKTIPVDLVVFDEYDEHILVTGSDIKLFTSPELALERMSHSKFKHERYLSTPTLPDFGINLVYQSSDQKHFFIKCHHCNEWTCLEEEFVAADGQEQKVLYYSKKLGRVIRACKHCGKELHRIGYGDWEWVAKRTGQGLSSGWWISQLNSCFIRPLNLLEQYEIHVLRTRKPLIGRPNPQEFWNSKIGHPWVAAFARLSEEQIRKCCSDFQLQNYDAGPCVMGVDQGLDLHVVIISLRFEKPTILFLGILADWEELDYYMKAFNVACCVVDALPETRNAKAFAARFPEKVFLNYYIESRKGDYAWNEEEFIVQENRTESLDESHTWIMDKEVILPASGIPEVEEFIKHCHSVAKKLIADETKGTKRYIYIKLGPDHFRHSFNYACIAVTRVLREGLGGGEIQIESSMISADPDWED